MRTEKPPNPAAYVAFSIAITIDSNRCMHKRPNYHEKLNTHTCIESVRRIENNSSFIIVSDPNKKPAKRIYSLNDQNLHASYLDKYYVLLPCA